MKAGSKQAPQEKSDAQKRKRKHQENDLDDAQEHVSSIRPSFSEQPTPPAVDRDREKT
jgi:hypothetical protein